MSAPERFQVGDTVRCVDPWPPLVKGAEYVVVKVKPRFVQIGDGEEWYPRRFVLVSRPTPPALDPFAWTDMQGFDRPGGPLVKCWQYAPTAWVAWSRFCYWATSVNIAAHFLPTEAAARTRASNGRDVPVAGRNVWLPDWVVKVCAHHPGATAVDHTITEACRRALGGEA